MSKLYTIVDTILECKGELLNIPFAVCFLENGVYSFDTRIHDSDFYKKYRDSYIVLKGTTDSNHKIEAVGLFISKFVTPSKAATLACDKFVKITKPWGGEFKNDIEESSTENKRVFAIELEGLKIRYSDRTEIERYRRSGKLEDFLNFEFDHNECVILLNNNVLQKNYSVLLTANSQNENTFIEFVTKEGYDDLFEDDFKKFRAAFIQFLSFINGAPLLLRKQFSGNFHTISGSGNVDAEITAIYSHKPLDKLYYSEYLPINWNHGMTNDILPILFLDGFNNYYIQNQTLDLNSLVSSLNEAHQTGGPKEQYYILITALEKIVNNFYKKGNKSETLIQPAIFNNSIKSELLRVLENYKAEIKTDNKAAYDIFKSRIGGINKIKDNDNKQKFYQFFNFCNIEVSPYLSNLIEVERNQAVHEGKVGNDENDALSAYLKLDHLLRDVILNLMQYNKTRNPKVMRQKPFPYKTPWSG